MFTNGITYDSSDVGSDGQPVGVDVIHLTVGQLKQLAAGATPLSVLNNSSAANRLNRLWSPAGALTTADYAQILLRDPFAANPNLDPASASGRFDNTGILVDFTPTADFQTVPFTLMYSTTSTAGHSVTDTYSVTFSFSTGASFVNVVGANLTNSTTFEYVNMSSSSVTDGHTQTATANIVSPLIGDNYQGPTNIKIFKDNIYGTFVFYGVPQ
jgi:hypothetical protein